MESETARIDAGGPAVAPTAAAADKGLKKGAIGFVDGLAIGLDSTARPTRWPR